MQALYSLGGGRLCLGWCQDSHVTIRISMSEGAAPIVEGLHAA